MEIVVAADRVGVARSAADIVERYVTGTGRARLGLATGATMEALYAELARRHRARGLRFADAEAYLLDEYLGLGPCDPCAYRRVVHRLFTRHVDLRPGAVHGPDPAAPDLAAECARYEQEVRDAKIGLQLLGIGSNGHIAFNEPGSPLDSTTRVVALSDKTRAANARFFPAGRPVPDRAITQGVATIGAAGELVLLACGQHKAEAVAQAVVGPVTSDVPASAIQLHPNVTVVLDPSASSGLARPLGQRSPRAAAGARPAVAG